MRSVIGSAIRSIVPRPERLAAAVTLLVSPMTACQCGETLSAVRGAVSGQICDAETGAGVPDIPVALTLADGSRRDVVTDARGSFVATGLFPGDAVISATVAEHDVRELAVEVVPHETTMVSDPACRELPGQTGAGGIEGTVCNRHTGALVADALIVVQLANGQLASTNTDADGYFLLATVPAGQQLLTVQATGFQRSFLVDVTANEITELDLGGDCFPTDGSSGTLSGALCDADGGPLVGATVSAMDAAGDERTDVTDTDGAFLLNALAPGPASVRVVREPDVSETLAATVIAGEDVVVSAAPGALSCEGGGGDGVTGDVEGTLCAPDGETSLAQATVYIVRGDGTRAQTTTDANGHFVLRDAPAGAQLLHVEKGSFSATIDVVVPVNGTLTIPAQDCEVDLGGVRIAVVTGEWDDVGTVLLDVGVDAGDITTFEGFYSGTSWVSTLLENPATLASYDIVFINCGADIFEAIESPSALANLRQFVTEGGSVYASDLTYDLIEAAFPSYIDFLGDDTVLQDAVQGEIADALPAVVSDAALAGALGTTNVSIAYPYGFAVMQSASSGVRIYIRGDAPLWTGGNLSNVPHTAGFTVGQGNVIYTSFHQEPGVNATLEQVLRLLMFEL